MARHRLPARHRATPRAPTSSSRSPLTATSRSRRRSRHRSAACISRTRFHCYNTSNRYRSRSSTIRSSSSLSPSLAGVEFFSSVPRAPPARTREINPSSTRARDARTRATHSDTTIHRSNSFLRGYCSGFLASSCRFDPWFARSMVVASDCAGGTRAARRWYHSDHQ